MYNVQIAAPGLHQFEMNFRRILHPFAVNSGNYSRNRESSARP